MIDDVWSSTIWQVIKCALPEENSGSRVIITTRNENVANSLSFNLNCVYCCGSIFGPGKEKQCPDELVACGNEILNKCGGVPLAIIVMAGLLATSKDQKTWKSVYKSFSKDQEEVQIRKILYLSYIDLPNYLKSCFLYLSVFPEGYVMRKDRVIRRWIAEGFIGKGENKSSQENGESCFGALINRGLIQPLPAEESGGVAGYVVYDLVRELIISLSAEENFVTVSAHLINLVPRDKIRRLSLQFNQEVTPTMPSSGILSNLRSLTVFGSDEENQHDPGQFRFLRVLDLEDAEALKKKDHQLQSIHKLFQLKYLGARWSGL